VTDHRVGYTINSIDRVMSGDGLFDMGDALVDADEKERIDHFVKSLEMKESKDKDTGKKKGKK
jgi:protein subunit release factor A